MDRKAFRPNTQYLIRCIGFDICLQQQNVRTRLCSWGCTSGYCCFRDRKMVRLWCVICRMKFFVASSFSWPTIKTSSTQDLLALARLLCLKRTISGGDFACFTSQTVSGSRCYVRRRTSTV